MSSDRSPCKLPNSVLSPKWYKLRVVCVASHLLGFRSIVKHYGTVVQTFGRIGLSYCTSNNVIHILSCVRMMSTLPSSISCPYNSKVFSSLATASLVGQTIRGSEYWRPIQSPGLAPPLPSLDLQCHRSVSQRRVESRWKSVAYKKDDKGLKSRFRCTAIAEATEKPTALPDGATTEDAEFMKLAVQLARKAVGHTSPNPMVGCVIVKDGQIVGRGFHPKAGEPHAEVFAIREAGDKARGATAYVTLEPCNHTGRTPPCSQALVRAQVKRVVVGTVDPNPLVGGKGLETLQKAGIQVVVGVEEALCQVTAETFFHRIVTKKPFVTVRYVMSLDGAQLHSEPDKIEAGDYFSILLQEHDVVMITDACMYDNPSLLSSEPGAKQPLRVILAKSLDLPLESQVFDTTLAPTLVVTDANAVESSKEYSGKSCESALRSKGVDVVAVKEFNFDSILDLLYQKGFNSVLLDSRGLDLCALENYLGRLAIAKKAQKLVVAISPVIVGNNRGGPGFVSDELLKLERVSTRCQGGFVLVEGYIPRSPGQ